MVTSDTSQELGSFQTVCDTRAAARIQRSSRQSRMGVQMMQQRQDDVARRSGRIGSVLSLATNQKNEHHGRGVLGIAFAVSGSAACCVASRHGIIGGGSRSHWIPVDQYKVMPDEIAFDEGLAQLRICIMKDELVTEGLKKIPLAVFRLEYETYIVDDEEVGDLHITGAVLTCKCKTGCTRSCKCVKNKSGCGPNCGCKGVCSNSY
jgi:hypothetical protein